MKHPKKKRKITIPVIIILLVISILYLLADRYLIEHVEGTVLDAPTEKAAIEEVEKIAFDDWNYTSNAVEIKINKVETGAGDELITYFVADVKLKDSSSLHTAFAENTFGRNIIEDTSKIAADKHAILAINGDYYGFRSNGILIRNGTLYRDLPARKGAALLKNGNMISYDETTTSSADLQEAGAVNTFSFGPILVANGEVAGDFSNVIIDTNFGNKSIHNANPRTGIGMISPNHFVFIVVDGRMKGYSKGMTLLEFAQLFDELGCKEAYNLDGGGSSTMYFMGRVVNNPLGKNSQRGVSDIVYIK